MKGDKFLFFFVNVASHTDDKHRSEFSSNAALRLLFALALDSVCLRSKAFTRRLRCEENCRDSSLSCLTPQSVNTISRFASHHAPSSVVAFSSSKLIRSFHRRVKSPCGTLPNRPRARFLAVKFTRTHLFRVPLRFATIQMRLPLSSDDVW